MHLPMARHNPKTRTRKRFALSRIYDDLLDAASIALNNNAVYTALTKKNMKNWLW